MTTKREGAFEGSLDVDLLKGVVPISKAASSLAALIKWSRANHRPVVITQKGYPSGVILDVELFTALRHIADIYDDSSDDSEEATESA
jgi:prevent-host-death family protein